MSTFATLSIKILTHAQWQVHTFIITEDQEISMTEKICEVKSLIAIWKGTTKKTGIQHVSILFSDLFLI